jgi:hypothetical protein
MSTTKSTASVRPAPPAKRRGPAHGRRREEGTGAIGTFVGFTIFLTLLLFSAQVLVRLYATSTLTMTANRAAQQVASSPDPPAAIPQAEAAAREGLGVFGATRTRFVWKEADLQQVVVEVTGQASGFLPWPSGWRTIHRTVTVRTERFR